MRRTPYPASVVVRHGKHGESEMSTEVSERGTGGAIFAATLMIIGGAFGILQGIALLAKGTFYVQPANYWINSSASTWGWWHLLVGVVVLAAGFGVLSGAAWPGGWEFCSSASRPSRTSSTSRSSPGGHSP